MIFIKRYPQIICSDARMIHTHSDKTVIKTIFGFLLTFLALLLFHAKAKGEKSDNENAKKAFRQADIINDGRIDTGKFNIDEFCVFYHVSMPCSFTTISNNQQEK